MFRFLGFEVEGAKGMMVWFPEGTRKKGELDKLNPFRWGSFKTIQEKQAVEEKIIQSFCFLQFPKEKIKNLTFSIWTKLNFVQIEIFSSIDISKI